MSRYLVDKFLYRVDRDESELKAYMKDPVAFVAKWEEEEGPRLNEAERTSGHRFTEEERRALAMRGRLLGVDGETVRMATENGEVAVPFAYLAKAKLMLTDELIAAAQADRKPAN